MNGTRRAVADTVRWLVARGLYAGTSGNVSARTADGLLITPTGVPCEDVDAASNRRDDRRRRRARPAGAIQ